MAGERNWKLSGCFVSILLPSPDNLSVEAVCDLCVSKRSCSLECCSGPVPSTVVSCRDLALLRDALVAEKLK